MKNGFVVVLVAVVALVGGYYLGVARSHVEPNPGPDLRTTQLPDGGMVVWKMKDGRPVEAHGYLLPNALDRAGRTLAIKMERYPADPNWPATSN
jgi:hypothetical protein